MLSINTNISSLIAQNSMKTSRVDFSLQSIIMRFLDFFGVEPSICNVFALFLNFISYSKKIQFQSYLNPKNNLSWERCHEVTERVLEVCYAKH